MSSLLLSQGMAADEIQQREKEDPDNIDELPIQPEVIDGRGMSVSIRAVVSLVEQNEQDANTDDHVQGVHAGHGKVEKEEELGVLCHIWRQRNITLIGGMDKVFYAEVCSRDVVLDIFLVIFNRLDAQEDQP